MLSICIFLSFFVFLALFFIFVALRIDFGAITLAYLLVLLPNLIPLVVIYLEQKSVEKKKGQISQKTDGN
ncbi:MAG: hypothetical protein ABF651_03210 [Sporolactobacillus sp.]